MLPGGEVVTAHGMAWVVEQRYPAAHQHGRYTLGEVATLAPEALALLSEPALGPRPAFLDTETTGLAGGAGTLIFLTGVGIWEPPGVRLVQVFLRDPAEEPAAVAYLAALLGEVSSLVTFNGAGFDLPLLESRFIMQRMPPAWRALPHLDLLTVARLLWRDHLPSRRLGALETDVLGIARTGDDLPGYLIPDAYRDYLHTGNTTEMRRILYHNEIDVLSMVTLLIHAARLAYAPEAQIAAAEQIGVGRLYARAGRAEEAARAWEAALEADTLAPDLAERLWRDLAQRHKRAARWEDALALWQTWAERLPWAIEPLEERAKYYEWTAKDFAAALAETQAALERAHKLPRGLRREQFLRELRQRQERLQRKLC